jgi:prepilin-type N-terminal cleavage/methylation domain-containing protein
MPLKRAAKNRRGLSLLEMMAATAIMATLTASVVVVMRSGYAVWNAQEADIDVLDNGYGVLRHLVTQMRQATAVTAITAAGDTQGSLSFTTSTGATRTWARNATSDVSFNNGASNQLLAKSIDSLTFAGYKADGVTATTRCKLRCPAARVSLGPSPLEPGSVHGKTGVHMPTQYETGDQAQPPRHCATHMLIRAVLSFGVDR